MTTAPTVPVTTRTLEVPGARLHYEIRGSGPLLALVAAPMDATAFAPLADLLAADHTVLTTDPRGINRSPVDDRDQDCTPEMRADDLARLLAHLNAGPAAVLGSSGGAVTVLALAQSAPERVHTVIAHEPPLDGVLPDREQMRLLTEDMIATYQSGDRRLAWAKFLAKANIHMPDEMFHMMFVEERDPQAAADAHYQFARLLRGTTQFQPDVDVLRAVPTRIVIGIGEDSAGEFCDRTSRALAGMLDVQPTLFPGGHIGFTEDPAAFAARLRTVLAGEEDR